MIFSKCVRIAAVATAAMMSLPLTGQALGPALTVPPEEVLDKYYLFLDASDPNVRYVARKRPELAEAQGGGYLFKMVKFQGLTGTYGGSATATLNFPIDTGEIKRLPAYANKELRVLNYYADPEDDAYIQFYDNTGKVQTIELETTTDAEGRISFVLPLSAQQSDIVYQSRLGTMIPAKIFMKKHVLTTNTDLKVNVRVELREIYRYFEANASLGFWIFSASYKQVRESHNIDRYITVKTFQGVNATGQQLQQAQEEAWTRIRELMFRQTITDKPRATEPTGGWPTVILNQYGINFYDNRVNLGGGWLSASVVDITRTRDETYEYRLEALRQEVRSVKLDYSFDVSALLNDVNRYYFLITKFPNKVNINVKTLSGLHERGVYEAVVDVWQKKPTGEIINTSTARISISNARPVGSAVLSINPDAAQTFKYFYRVSLSLPGKVIKTADLTNETGSSELTAPDDLKRFWVPRKLYIRGLDEVNISDADLGISYKDTHGQTQQVLVPLDIRRNPPVFGQPRVVNNKIVELLECDPNVQVEYEVMAVNGENFYETKPPVRSGSVMIQVPVNASPTPNPPAAGLVSGLMALEPNQNINPYDNQAIEIESLGQKLDAWKRAQR